jgi:hypothetical protein
MHPGNIRQGAGMKKRSTQEMIAEIHTQFIHGRNGNFTHDERRLIYRYNN